MSLPKSLQGILAPRPRQTTLYQSDMPTGMDVQVAPDLVSMDVVSPEDAGLDARDVVLDVAWDSTLVETASGPVRGSLVGISTVRGFLGIPYAAPPTGDLRWRPPTAPIPWTDARAATQLGAACPQGPDLVTGAPVSYSEDCLTLNVWAPSQSAAERRPVLVFVHGGGFTTGSGNLALYDGTALAERTGAVVVTLNYRLGALGFLAHQGLEDAAHPTGNGHGSAERLMDQQFALQWVQTNIAAFGGDAQRVAVFGESAGSISICAHMTSSLATGLFQRAIGQSGACTYLGTPLYASRPGAEAAEQLGQRFAAQLTCTQGTPAEQASCMRLHSVEDVLRAAGTAPGAVPGHAAWSPIVDGWVLTAAPWAKFLTGQILAVPYLTGINRDEATAFTLGVPLTTLEEYRTAIGAVFPRHVDAVVAQYPVTRYGSYRAAYNAFSSDWMFLCPTLAQATLVSAVQAQTYVYYFTQLTGIGLATGLGVFHSAELPFVFGNFVPPYAATDDPNGLVTHAMMDAWGNFAASGSPNPPRTLLWPPYSAANPRYQELGGLNQGGTELRKPECDALGQWVLEGP